MHASHTFNAIIGVIGSVIAKFSTPLLIYPSVPSTAIEACTLSELLPSFQPQTIFHRSKEYRVHLSLRRISTDLTICRVSTEMVYLDSGSRFLSCVYRT